MIYNIRRPWAGGDSSPPPTGLSRAAIPPCRQLEHFRFYTSAIFIASLALHVHTRPHPPEGREKIRKEGRQEAKREGAPSGGGGEEASHNIKRGC